MSDKMSITLFAFFLFHLAIALPSPGVGEQQEHQVTPKNTDNSLCGPLDFACGDEKCIPSTWVCDFENDCEDGSDERYCSLHKSECLTDEYQCKDETCIPNSWKCDDIWDCENGEDEQNCSVSCGDSDNCDESNVADIDAAVCVLCFEHCFPPGATVETKNGKVTMEMLEVGTEILTIDEQGQLIYSPVIAFLDRNATQESRYTTIETEDGTNITLTRNHLIYRADSFHSNDTLLNHMHLKNPDSILPVFASKVKVGDYIYTASKERNLTFPSRVIGVKNSKIIGIYGLLTAQGRLIVDNALVSCYGVVDDHRMVHAVMAPLRLLHYSMPALLQDKVVEPLGLWYTDFMKRLSNAVMNEQLQGIFHHSTVKHMVRETKG